MKETPKVFISYSHDSKELIYKVGLEDVNERLRLSIIEGNAPNQEPGYFITIGENVDATFKLFDNNNLT